MATPQEPTQVFGHHLTPDVPREVDPKYARLAVRLHARFGDGDDRNLRIRLFERIQREVVLHGEYVYRIVAGAVRSSESARDPGRYFCRVCTIRLREAGFWGESDFEV